MNVTSTWAKPEASLPEADEWACVGGVSQAIYTADTMLAYREGELQVAERALTAMTERLEATERVLLATADALQRCLENSLPNSKRHLVKSTPALADARAHLAASQVNVDQPAGR